MFAPPAVGLWTAPAIKVFAHYVRTALAIKVFAHYVRTAPAIKVFAELFSKSSRRSRARSPWRAPQSAKLTTAFLLIAFLCAFGSQRKAAKDSCKTKKSTVARAPSTTVVVPLPPGGRLAHVLALGDSRDTRTNPVGRGLAPAVWHPHTKGEPRLRLAKLFCLIFYASGT